MLVDYLKKLITPDMVFFGVPSGQSGIVDLTGKNPSGQCFGTHPNVPVISPPIDQIHACDATTGWAAAGGAVLSIDTGDKKEGTGSLKITVAAPEIGVLYWTQYNPAGTWDWPAKEDMLFWYYCDRASTAFAYVQLRIYDTLGNWRSWNLTFSAGTWAATKNLFSVGDTQSTTPPNLALVDKIQVYSSAADTTAFYFKLDDMRVTGKPSVINPSVGWVFGGDDDWIDYGNDASLALTRWTMGTWIYRRADSGDWEPLMSKSDNATEDYWLQISNADMLNAGFKDTGGEARHTTTTEVMPSHEWNFVLTTFDGTYVKIYTNADLKKTSDDFSAYTHRTSTRNFWINRLKGRRTLNGYQVFPFLVKGTWSQAQIDNFYLNTKGLFAPRG